MPYAKKYKKNYKKNNRIPYYLYKSTQNRRTDAFRRRSLQRRGIRRLRGQTEKAIGRSQGPFRRNRGLQPGGGRYYNKAIRIRANTMRARNIKSKAIRLAGKRLAKRYADKVRARVRAKQWNRLGVRQTIPVRPRARVRPWKNTGTKTSKGFTDRFYIRTYRGGKKSQGVGGAMYDRYKNPGNVLWNKFRY